MIGSLRGIVDIRDGQSMIVDVQGVGYKVAVPISIAAKSTSGEQIKLYIHTHVKDDAIDLYGFSEQLDLKLFEYLIGVSGVGPKTVLNIFSVGSRDVIIGAITTGDVHFFTAVPRLGKKNAQKIIIELKSKLGSTEAFDLSSADGEAQDEIIEALKMFGFSVREALGAIKSVGDKGNTVEEKVKLALKYLGK